MGLLASAEVCRSLMRSVSVCMGLVRSAVVY